MKIFHAHLSAKNIFFTLSLGYSSCEQVIIVN